MIVGTISYCVRSGLGLLAKSFYDNGVINRILEIKHPAYELVKDWYREGDRFQSRNPRGINGFLEGLDVLLLLENAFGYWGVVQQAREQGVKIVMMPMYEHTPYPLPVEAHLYICPSLLDLHYYRQLPSIYLPVPAPSCSDVPWTFREIAQTFVHNAGHGGTSYRNGTPELLDAMQYVKSPIRLILRAQPDSAQMHRLLRTHPARRDKRVDIRLDNVDEKLHYKLWEEGEAFVFPEKFNGLSLPLQEAHAAGMLVMAGDRFPMNTWLPFEPLIPILGAKTYRVAAVQTTVTTYSPATIARCIDRWYGNDISAYSLIGRQWRETNSWDVLKPRYLEALQK